MTLTNKTLDILFRQIDPEDILQEYHKDSPRLLKDLFMIKAESTLSGYSYEEKENVFRLFLKEMEPRTWWNAPPQFRFLAESAKGMLDLIDEGPVCKYQKTLEWRDIYLLLGQDMLTTSWLAQESLSHPVSNWFSWPAVIPVDNPILKQITDGLAENHMHFMAGASTFALTWCCLMNHPEAILSRGKGLEYLLRPYMSRGTSEIWSIKRRILYAAYIRMLLFKRIHGGIEDIMEPFERFHAGYTRDEWECRSVSMEIEGLRRIHGIGFPQPAMGRTVCLDYAFTEKLAGQVEQHSRLLAAERLYLFDCFRMCYTHGFSAAEQWVFYIYLLIKAQFRSEFVQVNGQVGFHNFHDYDSRKAMLWKDDYPEYMNEDFRQTVNANMQEQKIASLEGRLTPGKTAKDGISWVHTIDRACLFFDAKDAEQRAKIERWQSSAYEENLAKDAKHYYVLHFPKRKDPELRDRFRMAPRCRHQKFRDKLRTTSIELASALSNSDYYCQRIRGIDACSFEIVCRPEVFATAFRFLRYFPVNYYRSNPIAKKSPRLGLTYHVGEDFLDIADGLRAIDEAIHFLGMRRGDRLGHATVLGVEPGMHYATKSRQIIMTKQEALDTCTWVYYRAGELGVNIPLILRQRLLRKADTLFAEIYRDRLKHSSTTLEDYYLSMRLRGDDPRCYESGSFRYPSITDGFDMHCLNNSDPNLKELRCQERISELCFCYHYCYGVRYAGEKVDTNPVDDDYIQLMGRLQEAMRIHVNDAGISIECNPSSNVLIGTFGSYQSHPILTFYNRGLGLEQQGVQMHVSVNTDDPGVFDTSLSFEFDLLANALQSMTDKEGKRVNTDREIEAYIRDLVRMGREQCFTTSPL